MTETCYMIFKQCMLQLKLLPIIKVLFYFHTTSYIVRLLKKTKKFFVQTFAAIPTPLSRSQLPLLALAKTFQCQ
jgi:hypothetical protein